MTASRRTPVVLFLIADTGGGHRSAANAIRAAMDLIATESIDADARPSSSNAIMASQLPFSTHNWQPKNWGDKPWPWRASIIDIFEECGQFPLRRTVRLYGPAVENTPVVYAGFYYVTNIRPAYVALAAVTQSLLSRGLYELFEELRPDVIVSVHPLLTQPVLKLMANMGVRVPFLTVVTDLIRFHRAWAEPRVDLCSVPTAEARDLLISLGMPAEKIRLLGMPIHPKFCLPPVDRHEMRAKLGLDPDRFTVLVVGGGDGVGNLGETAAAIGNSGLPIQQIIVTGRNRSLYMELKEHEASFETPTKSLGFVQNMPDLMRAADVIATKAGPGTIMEALSCGLPIILTGAIPGQEEGNISFIEENEVGILAKSPEMIVEAIERYSKMSACELQKISQRAASLSNPRASFDIAQMIFNYLPSPRSVSVWSRPHRRLTWSSLSRRSTRSSIVLRNRLRLGTFRRQQRGKSHEELRKLPFLSRRIPRRLRPAKY
jgi:1,2-diacylglycerol 3-beta-galactosyltransferase